MDCPLQLSYGCHAVIVFFFISGFLTASNITRKETLKQFVSKRINRLYPTFWASMILTFLVTSFFHFGNVTISDFVANITMMPMVFGKEAVDGVYWTQQHEIFFYLIITIILYQNSAKSVKVTLLSWGLICVVSYFLQDRANVFLIKAIRVFLQPDYAAVFISGVTLGLYHKKELSKSWLIILLSLSLFIFYLWASTIQMIFLLISFILVSMVIYKNECVLNKETWITKPFLFIATISYPLYLVHQKIGFIVINEIITITGYNKEIIILIPAFVAIGIALVLHKYIENNNNLKIIRYER